MKKLRPFQRRALEALGQPTKVSHVICVAPTGSGKSLIYEQAALSPHRRTLLISPLVALARQQFKTLSEYSIPVSLTAGGSTAGPPSSQSGVWIISPEVLDFQNRNFQLEKWRPTLLVVDECHCLWEWGDRFRPSFSRIPDLIHRYQIPQSLWLTATLPHPARTELRKKLPQPVIEIGTFELPKNLQISICQISWKHRAEALIRWIRARQSPGIVFVATRESTLRVGRLIESIGKSVLTYHGGMSTEERQNAEMLVSKQIPEVVVATSAFGMGMNYPHLSYVVLWQAPPSLLSLVQSIGRVGRNSQTQAEALLLWDFDDFRLLEWTIQNSNKRRSELQDVLHFLKSPQDRSNSPFNNDFSLVSIDYLKQYFDTKKS